MNGGHCELISRLSLPPVAHFSVRTYTGSDVHSWAVIHGKFSMTHNSLNLWLLNILAFIII